MPPTTTRRRHDWRALRAEYAAGSEGLREFAEKRGLALNNVTARSSRDGWVEARTKYQDAKAARTLEKKIEWEATKESEIDRNHHIIANNLSVAIGNKASGSEPLRAQDIRALAEAQQRTYAMMRVTGNLPAEKEPMRIDLSGKLEVVSGDEELRQKLEAVRRRLKRTGIDVTKPAR